jgi:hypothetical protein
MSRGRGTGRPRDRLRPSVRINGFKSGVNTLDFVVNNDATGGPTAVMIVERGIAAVLEPAAIAVFILAALTLFGRRAVLSSAGRVS